MKDTGELRGDASDTPRRAAVDPGSTARELEASRKSRECYRRPLPLRSCADQPLARKDRSPRSRLHSGPPPRSARRLSGLSRPSSRICATVRIVRSSAIVARTSDRIDSEASLIIGSSARPPLQLLPRRSHTRLRVRLKRLEALHLTGGQIHLFGVVEDRPGNVGAPNQRPRLPEAKSALRLEGAGHELRAESESNHCDETCWLELQKRHRDLPSTDVKPRTGARGPDTGHSHLHLLES